MKQQKMILIVEDDPLLLKMYSTKFLFEGLEVFVADDGEKAMNFLSQNTPHLIILDLMLPKISGIDVAKYVRTEARLMETIIVVLSNMMNNEKQNQLKLLNISEFLLKSDYTPGQVVTIIKKYL